MEIDINLIFPNPDQPRQEFDEAELHWLAESIRENGLIQAITVRKMTDVDKNYYMIIEGERRWRACRMIGAKTMECRIFGADDLEGKNVDIMALAANIQRKNLNVVEEAKAFKKLRDKGMTLREIGDKVGYSMFTVSGRLALLQLEPEVQDLFSQKRLPFDPNMVNQVLQMPEESRVRTLKKCAENGLSAARITGIARRIKNSKALDGFKRTYSKAEVGDAWWMGMILDITLPKGVEGIIRKMCQDCPLFDHAGRSTCIDCAGLELLKKLYQGGYEITGGGK